MDKKNKPRKNRRRPKSSPAYVPISQTLSKLRNKDLEISEVLVDLKSDPDYAADTCQVPTYE